MSGPHKGRRAVNLGRVGLYLECEARCCCWWSSSLEAAGGQRETTVPENWREKQAALAELENKRDSYRLLCFWKETEDEKRVKGNQGNPTQQNCTSVDQMKSKCLVGSVLMANAAFRDTHTLLVVRDDEGHSLSAAVDSVAFPGRADLTEDH